VKPLVAVPVSVPNTPAGFAYPAAPLVNTSRMPVSVNQVTVFAPSTLNSRRSA
jgi:hypothetical protein